MAIHHLAGLVWAALAIATSGHSASTVPHTTDKERAKMETRYFLYTYSLDQFMGGVGACFFPTDRGLVVPTGNIGNRQEIGRYEGSLPAGSYQQLEALKREAWREAPVDTEPMLPGTANLTFGEMQDGKSDDLRGYEMHKIPPQLKALLAEADRLVEATLQHPKRVVRGLGSAEKAEFEAGATVAFRITLKSVGREAAVIDNALGSREPDSSGIQLYIEKDKPPEQMQESDQLWVDIPVRNLAIVEPKLAPTGRRATLAPGAELQFAVKKKLLLPPGRYRASAFYHASAGKPGQEVVEGRLRIDLGRFSVMRPPREK